jgi:hypothetical protein
MLNEKREQWPTSPKSHPVGSFIHHNMLSGNVRLQHRTVGCMNRTTWREHQHQALPLSVWHLWPPWHFFRGPKRWKSHDPKTPNSPTDSSLVAATWMEVSWTSAIKPWLCKREFHLFDSLKMYLVSYIPKCRWSSGSCLSHRFHWERPEFCAELIHSLITHSV